MPRRIPRKFKGSRLLGAVPVALAAMLVASTAWSQVPAAPLGAPGVPLLPILPVTKPLLAPAATDAAPPPHMLNNPMNRNPVTRAAKSDQASRPASASGGAAAPSKQGFGSPPVSRDTLVAPDPSRDGAPAAL